MEVYTQEPAFVFAEDVQVKIMGRIDTFKEVRCAVDQYDLAYGFPFLDNNPVRIAGSRHRRMARTSSRTEHRLRWMAIIV